MFRGDVNPAGDNDCQLPECARLVFATHRLDWVHGWLNGHG